MNESQTQSSERTCTTCISSANHHDQEKSHNSKPVETVHAQFRVARAPETRQSEVLPHLRCGSAPGGDVPSPCNQVTGCPRSSSALANGLQVPTRNWAAIPLRTRPSLHCRCSTCTEPDCRTLPCSILSLRYSPKMRKLSTNAARDLAGKRGSKMVQNAWKEPLAKSDPGYSS